jgi:hypothetical protein
VRAMREQHFGSRDPDVGHEMYDDDAVLMFLQRASALSEGAGLRE